MKEYTEKLTPSVGIYVIASLAIPFFTLTFAPFSLPLGIATGLTIFILVAVAMNAFAPRITVTTTTLHVGKAMIDRKFVGAVSAFSGDNARAQRGVNLDARAWTLFRGYVDPVVKVSLTDPTDPTPYWLVSTRNPQKLAEVLRTEGRRHS